MAFLLDLSAYLIVVVPTLIAMAYLTLAERKVLAAIQMRKGPNVVGILGVLQPFADALKLLVKEAILPAQANRILFLLAPVLSLTLAILVLVILPFGPGLVLAELDLGVLYLFGVSALGVYSVILAGCTSNSKYAFLGALRSTAQMISYDVSLGLVLLSVVIAVGTLNIHEIVNAQAELAYVCALCPAAVLFFISSLCEAHRAPFDNQEAESELGSGYNIEYGSMIFALFFLAEYLHIIALSFLSAVLFLGGCNSPLEVIPLPGVVCLSLKISLVMFAFICVRAAYPRLRFDQLMHLTCKSYLPYALVQLVFLGGLLLVFY